MSSREFGVLINRLHGALVLEKLPRIDLSSGKMPEDTAIVL